MTLLSLGMAAEFEDYRIAVNTLWPKTIIATAAIEFELGGAEAFKTARKGSIMADAAYAIISQASDKLTGQNLIDEEVLRQAGVTDFDDYAYVSGTKKFIPDLFVD